MPDYPVCLQNLGQSCSNDHKSACSRKEKKILKMYNAMSEAERQEIIRKADETIAQATEEAEQKVINTPARLAGR